MKILDCTFRDGGYYTNWSFDKSLVSETVDILNKSGVDYIELGYKSPVKGGRFRKCNDSYIKNIIDLNINAKLAFMIDLKDFITDTKINTKLLNQFIGKKKNSPFSMCRIAMSEPITLQSVKASKIIKDLGYETTINFMRCGIVEDKKLDLALETLTDDSIDILYIADSFGSLEVWNIMDLITKFRTTGLKLGIHCHDNMGLAFSNVLVAIHEGVEYIDATITGMGRGVGNVKLEQFLMYCKHKLNMNVEFSNLADLVTNKFEPLKKRYGWGWSQNYMLTGLEEIHPSYCQVLQNTTLQSSDIQQKLLTLEDKLSFNKEEIDRLDDQSVAVVIPARYKSSRFPGKPLAEIAGKPMIIRVADIAAQAVGSKNVFIATENQRIMEVVESYGYSVIITSNDCLTGTDRVAEAAYEIDRDIIINVQGDEPLLDPNDILKVLEEKKRFPKSVINCMSLLKSTEDSNDTKIPKLVTDNNNYLMYMSRSAIPGSKYGAGEHIYKQVCIYAFNKKELNIFLEQSRHGKTKLEWCEDIEILRFLELGLKVKMVELFNHTHAVDFPEDIEIVEDLLNEHK